MTDTRETAGIRARIWLAGRHYVRDPLPTLTPQRFEKKTRLSNSGLRVDRLFTVAGLPNIRVRYEIGLEWADLRQQGLLEHVGLLCSVGQPFDVALWKANYDVFDGDGTTKRFLIQRRQSLAVATPSTTVPEIVTEVFTYDKPMLDPTATKTTLTLVHKNAANIETGDPSSGQAWIEDDGHDVGGGIFVSTVRLYTAPVNKHDVLLVRYVPALRMVVDVEEPRKYGVALQEPRGLRLVELG